MSGQGSEQREGRQVYLAHCAISPLFGPAAERQKELVDLQRDTGLGVAGQYVQTLEQLHRSAAALLRTSAENISAQRNTSEGIGLVAGGYPFAPGDRVISYVHEYPANHYPWRLLEKKGVHLDLLPDRNLTGSAALRGPCAWDMNDLEALVTPRTRVMAISHVQFASGFAADLDELGRFCRDRGIDLIVDAAQSLGCLPLFPEENHIAAIASSGWKWLLGPVGSGLLYTSPALREKLGHVLVGAETMRQGQEYLDHRWQPHTTAKRFEYSTASLSLVGALGICLAECHLRQGIEEIRDRIMTHIDLLRANLDPGRFTPLRFPGRNRSGILSLQCSKDKDLDLLGRDLFEHGLVLSPRGGYLRLAPHFYLSEEEILRAAEILNKVVVS